MAALRRNLHQITLLRLGRRGLATEATTQTFKPFVAQRSNAGPPPSTPTDGQPATLYLKSGQNFHGKSFGAPRSVYGETVFSTSLTSYTESMTDPSYRAQMLVFTQPLIGNYGVPNNELTHIAAKGGPRVSLESERIQCAGVIVGELAERYSHYQAVESLSQWCARHNVPGITGVDTRAITTLLREQGTTLGRLAIGAKEVDVEPNEYWDPSLINLVAEVSTREPYTLNPSGHVKIALLDFGAKANIARSLTKRGASVTVLPWNFDFNAVRDRYDGLFLSNGPGDPNHCMEAALNVRKAIEEWEKPIFGICMGNQIIGLAAGLDGKFYSLLQNVTLNYGTLAYRMRRVILAAVLSAVLSSTNLTIQIWKPWS